MCTEIDLKSPFGYVHFLCTILAHPNFRCFFFFEMLKILFGRERQPITYPTLDNYYMINKQCQD